MANRVLIVGSGLTGAVAASLLRGYPAVNQWQVEVWDKARGAGGRMNTTRRSDSKTASVDIGAQYISPTPQAYKTHQRIFEELLDAQLLRPLSCRVVAERPHTPDTRHFVAPHGVGSLVKHFLAKSGAEVKFGHPVEELKQDGDGFVVRTRGGAAEGRFERVLLTMPIPQILALRGDVQKLLGPRIYASLHKVEYSSRFALGVFFKPGTRIDLDWDCKYVDHDPIVRYIAVDNRKRGVSDDEAGGPSVVVHTSVPFGLAHIAEDKAGVLRDLVLPRLYELVPNLPPNPLELKPHFWRYSHVFEPFPGAPGALLVQRNPTLLLAGDAFSQSKFDGCLDSAYRAVDILHDCHVTAVAL